MTDFVITEHDIELLNDPVMDKKKIWVRVRSRPLEAELKKERERVLDKLECWRIQVNNRDGKHRVELGLMIESLRSES